MAVWEIRVTVCGNKYEKKELVLFLCCVFVLCLSI